MSVGGETAGEGSGARVEAAGVGLRRDRAERPQRAHRSVLATRVNAVGTEEESEGETEDVQGSHGEAVATAQYCHGVDP